MLASLLLPLALSATALAHAAPPNPDQLFALQEAAASKASIASASSSSSATSSPVVAKHHGKSNHSAEKRDASWSPLKRHQHGQAMHGAGMGMQKKWVAKRGAAQKLGKPEEVREKRRRDSGLDSSEVAAEDEEESDLEARGDQYTLYEDKSTEWSDPSSKQDWATASATASSKAAASSSSSTSSSKTSSSSSDLSGYFTGASSYYLYALADAERYAVLDALKGGGFKVIRIFVAYVGSNNKVSLH